MRVCAIPYPRRTPASSADAPHAMSRRGSTGSPRPELVEGQLGGGVEEQGDADNCHMDSRWLFVRGEEQLELQRRTMPDGVHLLVVVKGEDPRVYSFPDLPALTTFQADMEH